ncbi:hypothetical protein AGMMS49992_04540 [Clostridia bacterium]|nr:hypothetical protein AGMMS49992_04540 [Clostridia bacterium]
MAMIRTKQFPSRSGAGPILLLLFLVFVCVAVLSSNAGFPLLTLNPFAAPAPTSIPLDPPTVTTYENTLTLERQSWYAIQVGTYESQDAAAEAASGLRARGGAGYVVKDGAHRLLVSCYPSREEAEEVMNRLVSGGDFPSSALYRMNSDELIISLVATPLQVSAMSQAYSLLPEMISELSRLSLALDRSTMDTAAVRASANTDMTRAKQLLNTMNLALSDPKPVIVQDLIALLSSSATTMEGIAHSTDDATTLSTQIKYSHVDLLWRYIDYVKAMASMGA